MALLFTLLVKPKAFENRSQVMPLQNPRWVFCHSWKKKKKSQGFPQGSETSYVTTFLLVHAIPPTQDTCTSYTSGPLYLLCLPKIFYPQDIHLAHSLNTLLKCYLFKEVFSDHSSTTYTFLSLSIYIWGLYMLNCILSICSR